MTALELVLLILIGFASPIFIVKARENYLLAKKYKRRGRASPKKRKTHRKGPRCR